MAPELFIPSVSWDQIKLFQDRHFPPAAQQSFFAHFIPDNQTTTATVEEHGETKNEAEYYDDMDYAYAEAEEQEEEEEEEDDLGYYSDGGKRTLTDAQIAIFRHSEVQEMLKAKRRELLAAADAEQAAAAEADETSANITEDYSTHDRRSRPMQQIETGALPWDDEDVCAWKDIQQQQQDALLAQQQGKRKGVEVPVVAKKPAVKPTYDAPSGKQFFWPVIGK